jgi:hypothetical protein
MSNKTIAPFYFPLLKSRTGNSDIMEHLNKRKHTIWEHTYSYILMNTQPGRKMCISITLCNCKKSGERVIPRKHLSQQNYK